MQEANIMSIKKIIVATEMPSDEKTTLDQLILTLIDEIRSFHYTIYSLDHIWEILFPDKDGIWHHIRVVRYVKHYIVFSMSDDECGYEFEEEGEIKPVNVMHHYPDERVWITYLTALLSWLKLVKKDWIAANKRVLIEYPLTLRQGIVPHSIVQSAFPSAYRLDVALGVDKTRKIVELVESLYFHKQEHTTVHTFTANMYFDYCKIAYIAGKQDDEVVDSSLSGREMYCQFADGRDDGLLEIDGDSSEEFANWIDHKHPLRFGGGHPWEIKRGGNTSNIKLSVCRAQYKEEGYVVCLDGQSLVRMEETLNMLLALYDANLPITIRDPESVRKRLLAQDNIGIIAEQVMLHRGNQRFKKSEDVFEVLHYKDLGRYKRRITPFITWEPLPLLRPRL